MKIKFLPQNLSIPADPEKSVMEQAREHKIPISSSCNGMCACAECRVYIVEGENHILPPSTQETELIGGGRFIDNRRLSCQLFCFGNVTVDVSQHMENQKQGIKKQFLKQIDKSHAEQSSSVGGLLVEQALEDSKTPLETPLRNKPKPLKSKGFISESFDKKESYDRSKGPSQKHKAQKKHRKSQKSFQRKKPRSRY